MENQLLQALSHDELQELLSESEEVRIVRDEVLPPSSDSVLFPLQGMVSVLIRLANGGMYEVGCVGREGVNDAAVLWSNYESDVITSGQIAGRGIVAPVAAVRRAAKKNAQFQSALLDYAAKRYYEACLAAACNARHSVPQRLAKWIMMASDRVGSSSLPLTHDYMAMMLGTRRATVTVAAQKFAKDGWIAYRRGVIEIVDPSALRRTVCECYETNPLTASSRLGAKVAA